MASGVLSTGQQVGGTIGVAVLDDVSACPGVGTPPAAFAQAFGLAVALDVAISVATVLVFALPRTNRPQG